jgi:hypothetical protein
MFRITRNRVVAAVSAIVVLAVAVGAYAYFSTGGSGTATATVGTSSSLTIKGTVAGALVPGVSQTVTFTIDNPSTAAQRVTTITLAEVKPDAGHSTCSTAITGEKPDFTMPAVAVNKTFGQGNNQAVTPTGTVTMNDTGISQDACQGATLTLKFTSN